MSQRSFAAEPTPETLEMLRSLIESSFSKPLRCLPLAIIPDAASLHFELVRRAAGEPGACVVITEDNGRVTGTAIASDLPWDSKVLGIRAAEVKEITWRPDVPCAAACAGGLVQEALRHRKAGGVQMVVCKTDTDNVPLIHALEQEGFRLMDTLLELVYSFAAPPFATLQPPTTADDLRIRLARDGDRERLMDVAECAFANHFGRFHSDERISRRTATEVYRQWLGAACDGYADWIFVAERDDRLAGFCVWKKPTPVEQMFRIPLAHLSIVAVHPDFAGRKYFQALVYAGMKHLKQEGFKYLTTLTHINNFAAQRGWANLGWKIGNARHALHNWL